MKAPASDLPIVLNEVSVDADNSRLLDRLHLTFRPGSPTVLMGPNGAGKTTLLHVAMGLLPPSSGYISWGGRKTSPPKRRAIVFQRPVMLRRSAAANLHYALRKADQPRSNHAARAQELLALVGLEALANRPARKLSAGEQQRLAIARALARDPEVLFLDEPMVNLDPAATKMIEETIGLVSRQGIKVIMATHDLGQATRLASEIVLLHRGRVVEVGEVTSFFATPSTQMARKFLAGELLG